MVARRKQPAAGASASACVAVSVGNTRTAIGAAAGARVRDAVCLRNDDVSAIADAIAQRAGAIGAKTAVAAVVASVNEPAAQRLLAALAESNDPALRGAQRLRLGVDLPIPIRHALGPQHTTGQDRFLAALAAYRLLGQACVVVDAGTAITVDFVDGEGVFHGGAIAPGLAMGLDALHARAAQLPGTRFEQPNLGEAFPKTTRQAMLTGVWFGAIGLVRALTERYAERFGAYPKVIATGGDAEALFANDPFVDRIEPDLVLAGVGTSFAAWRRGGGGASSAERGDEAGPHAGLAAL